MKHGRTETLDIFDDLNPTSLYEFRKITKKKNKYIFPMTSIIVCIIKVRWVVECRFVDSYSPHGELR
jgi:hypothetical protein